MAPKVLVAFDFDHSIIDDNSDLYVRKLAPNGKLPQSIKDLYRDDGWTNYMAEIFKYLHKNSTTEKDILQCMSEIPLIDGMAELFSFLQDQGDVYDAIIISDSNSVFIEHIMRYYNILDAVKKVYTNPAEFNTEGCLTLKYYHTQDWCDLSTVNLCKGHILDEHIREQKQRGVEYDTIAFVGDGTNDLCPSIRLRKNDICLPRVGFSLMKKIKENWKGGADKLCAKIIPWNNGHEIKSILEANYIGINNVKEKL